MTPTSGKNSANKADRINLIKNMIIFFGPLILSISAALQSGTSVTVGFVIGGLLAAIIKFLDYYTKDNTTFDPGNLMPTIDTTVGTTGTGDEVSTA